MIVARTERGLVSGDRNCFRNSHDGDLACLMSKWKTSTTNLLNSTVDHILFITDSLLCSPLCENHGHAQTS